MGIKNIGLKLGNANGKEWEMSDCVGLEGTGM